MPLREDFVFTGFSRGYGEGTQIMEKRLEETNLLGFRPSLTQTRLYSHRKNDDKKVDGVYYVL